jgi:hypothetical protein
MSFELSVVTVPQQVVTIWVVRGVSFELLPKASAVIYLAGYADQKACDDGSAPIANVTRRMSVEQFAVLSESAQAMCDAAEKWLLETPESDAPGIKGIMIDQTADAFCSAKRTVEKSGTTIRKTVQG